MSQRSPQNQRNIKGVSGVAHKSASSAKPAREAAANVRVVPATTQATRKQREASGTTQNMSKEQKKAAKRARRELNDRMLAASNVLMSQDPNFSKRRRTWWGMLGVGLICVLIAWVMVIPNNGGADLNEHERFVAYTVLALAYVAIFGAFIFDFVKIRPIRKDARSKAGGMSVKKLDSILETSAREREERNAAKKARRFVRKRK